jgi:hypothetical protein
MSEDEREHQAAAQEPATPTPCEAERRNRQALYVLENEWGCGRIDVGALRRILRGDEPDTCECEPERMSA